MISSRVVINAGPLMTLAKLNLLHLLKGLYGRIFFAEAVYIEVVIEGVRRGYPDAFTLLHFLQQEAWQFTPSVTVPPLILAATLDRGEQGRASPWLSSIRHRSSLTRRQVVAWREPMVLPRGAHWVCWWRLIAQT